jgi:capsular polysaccharide export protein
MAWQAFGYSVANILGKAFFPHYRHHRPLGLAEGACWIRAAWRKWYWRYRERNVFRRLHEVEARRYFLAPLQVFNDAQVTAHGPVRNVSSFICQVAESFARHAPADTLLVFKHHPMDRGHTDYAPLIHQLSQSLGIADRILYVHDLHLPTLLQRTQGVVVINSTVGLSALCHGAATLTLGSAIFDLPGLTFQGSLDDFWRAARTARPAPEQVQRFKQYLIARTQINGSFYRALPGCDGRAGLAWAAYSNVPRPLKTAPQAEELAS